MCPVNLKFSVHFQFVTANPEYITQLCIYYVTASTNHVSSTLKCLNRILFWNMLFRTGQLFCNMQCRHVKHCFVVENGWVIHAVLNTFHCKACQNIHNTFLVRKSIWLLPAYVTPARSLQGAHIFCVRKPVMGEYFMNKRSQPI